jgi:translation elongation factor EF-4
MEIIQERLEREFNLELITTAPTVTYRVVKTDGSVTEIDNPSDLPDPGTIERIEEPMILATIHVPNEYIGGVLGLCEEKRGPRNPCRSTATATRSSSTSRSTRWCSTSTTGLQSTRGYGRWTTSLAQFVASPS